MTAGIIIRNFDGTDDTVIAVDRRLTHEGRFDDREGCKIFRGATVAAVASGNLAQIQRLFSRLRADLPREADYFPVTYAEEEFNELEALAVFSDGRAVYVSPEGDAMPLHEGEIEAIGTGGEFLVGAFCAMSGAEEDRLHDAFEMCAGWRADVSPDFDMERISCSST